MANPIRPVQLVLLWHLHQPDYAPFPACGPLLPWTRLHTLRNYADLFETLGRHPAIRSTVHLDPVLLERFEAYAARTDEPDPFLRVARRPAESLGLEERRFVITAFLDVRRDVVARDLPRLHELAALRGEHGKGGVPDAVVARFDDGAIRDLQVLFHLAWCGGLLRADDRVRDWIDRGRGFAEDDKQALLDVQADFLAGALARLRALAAAGHVEIATGPYFHPVVPLVCDVESAHEADPLVPLPEHAFAHPDDARAQLDAARARFERALGTPPAGGWSPEGAISDASLAVLAEAGWGWTGSDEGVLFRTLGERNGGARGAKRVRLHRAWRAEGGPVVLFRDAELSVRLAEDYGAWSPALAAADFVHRLTRMRRALAREKGTPTITVAVDGENVWDDHPSGCGPFLDALFARLGEVEAEIRTVRARDAAAGETEPLPRVSAGSWVDAGLGAWVGARDANRAWALLAETRAAVAAVRPDPDLDDPAWRAVFAAEGSDWFRWFSTERRTVFADDLDACFRGHLRRAWTEIDAEPPATLAEPIAAARDAHGFPPAGPVRPTLDGRVTDWFEWLSAGRVDAPSGLVTAAALPVRSLRYGGDGANLVVRLDPSDPPVARGLAGAIVRFRFPGWPERTLTVVVPVSGPGEGGPLRVAADRVAEFSVPTSALPGDGDAIRFLVEIEAADGTIQRIPDAGTLTIPAGVEVAPEWDWHV